MRLKNYWDKLEACVRSIEHYRLYIKEHGALSKHDFTIYDSFCSLYYEHRNKLLKHLREL